jgi:hypothetical protein
VKKEQTVTCTYGEIFDRISNSTDFAKIGINEWCLNEGLATRKDTRELTKDEALVFMSEYEWEGRTNHS